MNTTTLTRGAEVDPKPLGIVQIECSYPVLTFALKEILEGEAEVFEEGTPQWAAGPSAAILYHDWQDVASEVRRLRNRAPGVPVVVVALSIDPRLALSTLRAGAHGFIHAGMHPKEVVHAVRLASEGKRTVPESLLETSVSIECRSKPDGSHPSPAPNRRNGLRRFDQRSDSRAPLPHRIHYRATLICGLQAPQGTQPHPSGQACQARNRVNAYGERAKRRVRTLERERQDTRWRCRHRASRTAAILREQHYGLGSEACGR